MDQADAGAAKRPDEWGANWTPPEAWVMAALAERSLVVRLGNEDRVVRGGEDARLLVRPEVDPATGVPYLVVQIEGAEQAELALRPEPGNDPSARWHDGWAIELVGPSVPPSGGMLLSWGPPVRVRSGSDERRRTDPIRAELRIASKTWRPRSRARGLSEVVPVVEVGFYKHTRQSSAAPRTRLVAFSAPTAPEPAPFWEVDLGSGQLLTFVRIDLAPLPAGTEVRIEAFAFSAKGGGPPPGTFQRVVTVDEPSSPLTLRFDDTTVIARLLRVSLVARPPSAAVVLEVLGLEVHAARLFAPTLRETLRRAFAVHADRTLFEEPIRGPEGALAYIPRLTYGEVWARSERLARALGVRLDPAVRADGRVFAVVLLRNRPEWAITDLAILARGWVSIPLSPDDPDARLAGILARLAPDLVVCDVADAGRVPFRPRLLVTVGGSAPGAVDFAALLDPEAGVGAPLPAERPEDALYAILFTSGSTGAPKGAMRSYATFRAMLESYGASQSPRHLSFQPLSHLSERMVFPWLLVCGATIAFSTGPAALLEELRAFEPTELASVPRLYDIVYAAYQRRLARGEPEASALAVARRTFGGRLRSLAVGSAPVAPAVLAFLRRCFADLWVSEGYGSTEVGTIALDHKIAAHVAVKLVPLVSRGEEPTDRDRAANGPAAERGEIWVRTPHAISGYFGEEGSPVDADGYFPTGDLGERDPDGTVRVVGRLRNAVKLAHGEFVSAESIEGALATMPGVDRVYVHVEAGAPGVAVLVFPAADRDTPAPTLAALRSWADDHGLAPWELPRGLVVATEVPAIDNGLLTSSGKLARSEIASRYGARLAAAVAETPAVADAAGDGDLAARLAAIASGVVGRPVAASDRLATTGIDSLAVSAVLAAIGEALGRPVPLRRWFEVETLAELAARLEPAAHVRPAHALEARAREELARRPALDAARMGGRQPAETVLLTGATGLLGAHILEELVQRSGLRVVCLVRAADRAEGERRLAEAASRFAIAPHELGSRVRVVAGDLGASRLGCTGAVWDALALETDVIVHAGARVSWLASFDDLAPVNVGGTRALLELAGSKRTKALHFVSTISTAPLGGDETTTLLLEAIAGASPYALSKWIAEAQVALARAELPVTVHRPGMIVGHSERGRGNPDDFIHRYIAAVAELGLYVVEDEARIDLTPVDFVARAIVALVGSPSGASGAVHHLVNVDRSPSFTAFGEALVRCGVRAEPASYADFRAAVVAGKPNRLTPLASFFPPEGFAMGMGPWPCVRTVSALERLGVVRPTVDDRFLLRVVRSLGQA